MRGLAGGTGDAGDTGDPPGLTGLVIQEVVLLHELPVELQSLGCPGGVKDVRMLVEQLLEGVERGLAGLWRGEGTHGSKDPHREPKTPGWNPPIPLRSRLALTDPTLFSSCSSALLNSTLLWMAAIASGCSCRMAWQASLVWEGNHSVRAPTGPHPGWLCPSRPVPHSLGDDGVVEERIPPLLDLPQVEAAAELHAQVHRGQVIGLEKSPGEGTVPRRASPKTQ